MSDHPILKFWFGNIGPEGVDQEHVKRWYKKSTDFDEECRRDFEAELEAAKAGKREALKDEPRGCLAFIILCDQISRNIYRDSPDAFAADPLALQATMTLIEKGLDQHFHPSERSFLYMPLMHSEDPSVHTLSIEKFTELKDAGHDNLKYAHMHKDIVDRFGRYPHRNAILGRESTEEEVAFLSGPNSSF